jgi:hypothetical protein
MGKDLEALKAGMAAFRSKTNGKKQAITQKMQHIDDQTLKLREQVKLLRSEVVSAELAGTNAAKLKTEISKLKNELADLDEQKTAYSQALSKGDHSKDLTNLQKLGAAARDERGRESKRLHDDAQQLREQAKDAIKKAEKNENTFMLLNQYPPEENELLELLPLIDERTKGLQDHEKRRFLQTWLRGEDTQPFFEVKEHRPASAYSRITGSSFIENSNDPGIYPTDPSEQFIAKHREPQTLGGQGY